MCTQKLKRRERCWDKLCLRSVVGASLPIYTVWEIDQAFRVHLLRRENNDRKAVFGKLQKRMEIDGKLARWIRAYIFASFCACKKRQTKCSPSRCCNIQEEVALKSQGGKEGKIPIFSC